MTALQVRNWLGLYVLCFTAFLGGYSFLASDAILPLEFSDRTASFEIILPFLVAQVAAVYRFYSDKNADDRVDLQNVPAWIVKAPPILVTILVVIQLASFGIAGLRRDKPPSPEAFKGLLTFCVALLNASTVLVITRYFDSKKASHQ